MAEIYDYNGKPTTAIVKQGDKYVMEFDAMPALVYVSYDGNGNTDQTFEHGVFKDDIKSIEIRSAIGELSEFTTSKQSVVKSNN